MLTNCADLTGDTRMLVISLRCFSPCSSQWIPMMWRTKSKAFTVVWSVTVISLDHLSAPSPSTLALLAGLKGAGVFQVPQDIMLVPIKGPALAFLSHTSDLSLEATSSKRPSPATLSEGAFLPYVVLLQNIICFIPFIALGTPRNDLAFAHVRIFSLPHYNTEQEVSVLSPVTTSSKMLLALSRPSRKTCLHLLE